MMQHGFIACGSCGEEMYQKLPHTHALLLLLLLRKKKINYGISKTIFYEPILY